MKNIFVKKNRNFGFTLSEVLLGLTIVAIVAILTLPAVINNFQKNSMLAMLNKNYVELQQNLTFLQSERFSKSSLTKSILSLANPQSDSVDTSVGKFFDTYYSKVASCITASNTDICFASNYTTISGKSGAFACKKGDREGLSRLLQNGSAMCIIPANMNGTTFVPAIVYIDVNGTKSPNKAGRDLFTFNIYNDFTIDEIAPLENEEDFDIDDCMTSTTDLAKGCFRRILKNNWKIDY